MSVHQFLQAVWVGQELLQLMDDTVVPTCRLSDKTSTHCRHYSRRKATRREQDTCIRGYRGGGGGKGLM